MKNFLLIILLFIGAFAFGQFNYNAEGLNPKFTVIEFANKSQSELYQSTLNWIKDSYKNPDEVIKSTIENNKIRFEGINQSAICIKTLGLTSCYNAKYTIEIEFKDGKLRFLPSNLQWYQSPSKYTSGGWYPVDLDNGSFYYNKKGELRDAAKLQVPVFSGIFNDLTINLKDYINKGKDNTANSDW